MATKRAVIVGAGPGGLTSAMMLAHNGYDVTVYEKQDYVGGRNGAVKAGGYTFDIGPTFLMMLDVLETVFEKSGRKVEDYLKITKLDPMYRLLFPGDRAFYPSSDHAKMEAEIERMFPGNAAGYRRYLKKEGKKHDTLLPCLQIPYGSLKDYAKWQFVRSLPYLDAHISLFGVLGRYFNDDDLKTAFTFQAKYIGMSPWTAPGTFSIISFIEHSGGIYHVEGGLNRISAAMADVTREEGGIIKTGTGVKRIIVEDGTATGVELEHGGIELADYVVINADFAHAMTHIVEERDRPKYTDAKLEKKLYSCSTFMLYLGVNKKFDDLPHHSIVFSDDYKKNVAEITDSKILSDDPSFYVQNASVTDPTLAPEGKSTIYILVPVPNKQGTIDWQREKRTYRDKILEMAEIRGGYTGLRDAIEEEVMITPDDWVDDKFVYKGATFNLGHNVGQMLLMRPHNEFEEFKNCYLVGGGTHPGSGLPTIYESGRISSELILQRDGKL